MAANCWANMVFPLGFRFLPSYEELIKEYLRPKIMGASNDPELHSFIPTIDDICKSNPRDLPSLCSDTWNQNSEYCYFICKWNQYGKGARCDRKTKTGYWKKTGKEYVITDSDTEERIGVRSILVFYEGRNPGIKTDHIMHVCELKDDISSQQSSAYVVCRLQIEKNKAKKTEKIGCHLTQQEDNNGLSHSQESFLVDGGERSVSTTSSPDIDASLTPTDTASDPLPSQVLEKYNSKPQEPSITIADTESWNFSHGNVTESEDECMTLDYWKDLRVGGDYAEYMTLFQDDGGFKFSENQACPSLMGR